MSAKKLTKEALGSLIDEVIKAQRVFGVKSKGDKFDFGPLDSAGDLRLDYDVTLQPPKQYFLPQRETLMTYDIGGGYKSEFADEAFVLVGVHPYDVAAINQMDELFSQDNYDSHYMTRRRNATIIACDVVTPSAHVFASCMGTAVVKKGYDLLLTDVGDGYVAEAATENGRKLLALATEAKAAGKADLEKRQSVWDRNEHFLNKHNLECNASYLPRLLNKAYRHSVWDEKSKMCFSCGSCNLVCPTCYCFDVQDDVDWDLKCGRRDRCWDGCLLDGFTKVAPDHEFRKDRASRFRHRLYRKAKYVPAKIGGEIACVGCGRCVGACLPDIANPVSIYNELVDDLGIG